MKVASWGWLLLALGCGSADTLREESAEQRGTAVAEARPVEAPAPAPEPVATTPPAPKPLPTLGDPLGLLSRKQPGSDKLDNDKLRAMDPGALMGSDMAPTVVKLERDPRAVKRSIIESPKPRAGTATTLRAAGVREISAASLMQRVRGSGAPQVLYVHASYCKACRASLPRLLKMVEAYQGRGVRFTAASVDSDANVFADYAPALQGLLEPLWISRDGTLRDTLASAGVAVNADSISIPLFAVFRERRVVAQGHSRQLRDLPTILDGLL
jgi:hypothetical protein